MSGIIGESPNMRSGEVGVFPAGHVIQTVTRKNFPGATGVTGTTWTPTLYTFFITPQKTSSKIVIMFSIAIDKHSSASYSDGGGGLALFRDIGGAGYPAAGSPTVVFYSGSSAIDTYLWNNTTAENWEIADRNYYSHEDSPATTSLVTYKIYLKQWSTRSNITVGNWGAECTSVLQEIAQ